MSDISIIMHNKFIIISRGWDAGVGGRNTEGRLTRDRDGSELVH